MAKIRIKGDTSGYIDIAAPSVAGTQTISLSDLPRDGVFSADSDTVATFNRTTSDGAIVDLQKDGTSVGNIGYGPNSVSSASGPWIGNDTSGRVVFANNDGGVIPWTDATMDLGNASAQFNRLFVSSGIVFGGDTTNNFLDDYEEGTFTPTVNIEGGGTVNTSLLYGAYTKIGNQVTVNFGFDVSSTSGAGSSNALQFQDMPFTSSSSVSGGFPITIRMQSAASSSNYWSGQLFPNSVNGRIEAYNGTGLINSSTYIAGGTSVRITIAYLTD